MFIRKIQIHTCLLSLVLVCFIYPLLGLIEAKAVELHDLNRIVHTVQGELELIRKHKQRTLDERSEFPVEHVYPREVYFQALTLRQKAGRLCHETKQFLLAPPTIVQYSIPKNITPNNVYEIVSDAWNQIQCAKAGMKIHQRIAEANNFEKTITLTDIFKSIVQANRQLNLLLEQPIEPGDVYAVVQHANTYIIDILNKLAPVWSLTAPTLPEYQHGVFPIDVYKLMLKNLVIIEQIAKESGIDMLHLRSEIQPPITSTDVFDLSTLILSELSYFALQIGIDRVYKLKSHPDKVQSDVFQQAQIIEQHLQILGRFTEDYPTWTKLE